MAITATKPEGKEFKQLEQGVYPARCISVIDLGTHKANFNGEEKEKHLVRVVWEFPTELAVFDEEKGEQPFILSKNYTLSLFQNSVLRKDLEAWLGRALTPQEDSEGFDLESLIGKECQIQVIHNVDRNDNKKVYANISGIMACPKGMKVDDQINPPLSISQEDWGSDKYNDLPEFVRKKIEESKEWKSLQAF